MMDYFGIDKHLLYQHCDDMDSVIGERRMMTFKHDMTDLLYFIYM